MHDLDVFGAAVLVVSLALLVALLSAKLSGRLSIPAPAVFLVAAALTSDFFPSLNVSIKTVERVATVALIVILLDGGASIGWRRFRKAVGPIASLGVVGTFATAGAAALFAHWAFGLDWTVAGLRRRGGTDRSSGDVLGHRRSRPRAGRDSSRGRIGRERSSRDRPHDRDDRAGDPPRCDILDRRPGVLCSDDRRSRGRSARWSSAARADTSLVATEPGPLHPAHSRRRGDHLRGSGGGQRLRLPGGIRRRPRHRRHGGDGASRDRNLPGHVGIACRDRRIRSARPDDRDLRHQRNPLGARTPSRRRPRRAHPARGNSAVAPTHEAPPRRTVCSSRGEESKGPSRSCWRRSPSKRASAAPA